MSSARKAAEAIRVVNFDVALRELFPPREYAVLAQVRNGTGFARQARTADYVIVSLWPSRGLEIIGVELKSFRGDWRRELKDPAKAEEMARRCDRWYLAIDSTEVATLEEVPAPWGLIQPKSATHLRIARQGAVNPDPTPISRSFLAAVLRKAQEWQQPKTDMPSELAKQAQYRAGQEAGQRLADQRAGALEHEVKSLRDRIARFEQASGVRLDTYQTGLIGEAVEIALRMRTGTYDLDRMEAGAGVLRQAADRITEARAALLALQFPGESLATGTK